MQGAATTGQGRQGTAVTRALLIASSVAIALAAAMSVAAGAGLLREGADLLATALALPAKHAVRLVSPVAFYSDTAFSHAETLVDHGIWLAFNGAYWTGIGWLIKERRRHQWLPFTAASAGTVAACLLGYGVWQHQCLHDEVVRCSTGFFYGTLAGCAVIVLTMGTLLALPARPSAPSPRS